MVRSSPIAGPEIAQDLGIDLRAIASISAVIGFISIPLTLSAGWWADRHRRLPLLAAGTVFSGVFSILGSTARSAFSLGAPRAADSVATLAGGVPRSSLLADYYPAESRGKVFALLGSTDNIPIIVAPVLGGILVDRIGWRLTNVIFALPLLVMGVAIFLLLREPIRGYMERRALGVSEEVAQIEDEPRSFAEGFRLTFAVRTLRRVFIALIFFGAGLPLISLILPFFLAEQYGLNVLQRVFIGIPPTLAAMVGTFYGGGLVDYFIRRNPARVIVLVALANGMTVLVLSTLMLTPPIWLFIGVNTLLSLAAALTGPAVQVIVVQIIPPSIRTQGVQSLGLASLPGYVVLPILAGLVITRGYGAAFGVGAVISLIGVVILATAGPFFETDMRAAFAEAAAEEEWRRSRASGESKLLVCRGVDVGYDNVQVLFDVDFDVEAGEIIALLGTNGAGKSTLLRAISGTNEASNGAIVFDGRDITHMPPHEVAGRGVVHMPGGRGVFPGLTVRENILLGRWLGHADLDIDERLAEVFEIFPVLRERAMLSPDRCPAVSSSSSRSPRPSWPSPAF